MGRCPISRAPFAGPGPDLLEIPQCRLPQASFFEAVTKLEGIAVVIGRVARPSEFAFLIPVQELGVPRSCALCKGGNDAADTKRF